MKLNDMLYDLIDLAKQENEPNRYAHSEEYDKLFNELDDKTMMVDVLEKELGCPLDVYVNATINGIIVGGEWFPVKIHKDTNGYYFALSNGSAFPFYLSSYKKTWWLREDRSE